jgi:hypothetical protein
MNTGTNGSNEIPDVAGSHVAGLHVQEVIRSAERELYELVQRRAELMKRIGTIKQTLVGLANIFGNSVLSDELLTFLDRRPASRQPGFTRACRLVLMEAESPLGTREVCEQLQRRFPELIGRHREPIASVTTVLNRLVDYAEARCSTNGNGRRVWEWAAEQQDGVATALLRFVRERELEKQP